MAQTATAKPAFRPTAIPLIACDPYFSVWSFTDRLTGDKTRHWTGAANSMFGALLIDGEAYCFLGNYDVFDKNISDEKILEQVSVTVDPTTTVYRFTHPTCDFKLTFFTPLLLDRPEVFSRPVSYIDYEILPKEEGHTFEVYFDASCQLAGDLVGQTFDAREERGHVWVGATEQKILSRSGDDLRIEWGYLHLIHENAKVVNLRHRKVVLKAKPEMLGSSLDLSKPISCSICPILCATSQKLSDRFILAYDDIHSIQYFGKYADAYYKSVYGSFEAMLEKAVAEADQLKKDCEAFDRYLIAEMEKVNPTYAKIGALAYRQAVAAHKLVLVDGKMLFLSKECFSNGCIATLDVTYPSIPLFLLFNPELVRGMMRPIFDYARSKEWNGLPYAPHDCGCYPLCNGQVYGVKDGVVDEHMQMPVEECGNAILTMAAIWRMDGDRKMLDENRDLLTQWADYLVKYGYDPGEQLCTDDFAGHLSHNCNLSLKAIVALGTFATLFGNKKYAEIAKVMAERWTKEAKIQGSAGYRLTFTQNDTWSLKYNLVWDRLFGLGLFDESVSREEISVYREKMNRYGTPLDSRAAYTKLDWLMWTTVLLDDPDYTNEVCEAMRRMIAESADRVPLVDWYFTDTGRARSFQARSVVGGLYINLLAEKLMSQNQ